ncbi:hypothetical protein EI94DRAFT_914205 [Lactarius quietus]|nr:hypothetical protein EI94DRAFT_914205 [Lactarius quietus]
MHAGILYGHGRPGQSRLIALYLEIRDVFSLSRARAIYISRRSSFLARQLFTDANPSPAKGRQGASRFRPNQTNNPTRRTPLPVDATPYTPTSARRRRPFLQNAEQKTERHGQHKWSRIVMNTVDHTYRVMSKNCHCRRPSELVTAATA